MANAKEVPNPTPRELMFWGEGKAADIKRGFAITSLRNTGDSYDFARGERILANCVHDGEKVPVVIIGNDFLPLSSHEIPVLALDWVFDHKKAAEMLRQYPTYEKTEVDTPLRAIVFLDASKLDSLPKDLRERLINPENLIISLIRDRELREIFFPTMFFWSVEFGGKFKDWVDFLRNNKLIDQREALSMESFARKNKKDIDWCDHRPYAWQELSMTPSFEHFRLLILGLPKEN